MAKIYDCTALTWANQAVSESSAQAVTEDTADVLSKGLLLGCRCTITDNDGDTGDTVTVRVYKDSTLTVAGGGEELYSAEFGFSSDAETLSDLLASPVPFFEQPYVTVEPASESDTDVQVTLYCSDGK